MEDRDGFVQSISFGIELRYAQDPLVFHLRKSRQNLFLVRTDIMDEITEDRLLKLEREAFLALIREPRTLARIETMLETGKPLRN